MNKLKQLQAHRQARSWLRNNNPITREDMNFEDMARSADIAYQTINDKVRHPEHWARHTTQELQTLINRDLGEYARATKYLAKQLQEYL